MPVVNVHVLNVMHHLATMVFDAALAPNPDHVCATIFS
jgi:hypothetical protein